VRDLVVLILHLLATVARLAGPGGARAVVAESVLVKQQLLILNLRLADRVVAGVCTLVMRPSRLVRAAIVLKASTLLRLLCVVRTQSSAKSPYAVVIHDGSRSLPESPLSWVTRVKRAQRSWERWATTTERSHGLLIADVVQNGSSASHIADILGRAMRPARHETRGPPGNYV